MVVVVAAADLSLPDLLSQIINVGIQQRGIESGAPDALSIETMQALEFLHYFHQYPYLYGNHYKQHVDQLSNHNHQLLFLTLLVL